MSLWEIFHLYTLSKEDMDSRTFVKLCRETKLLDKNFNTTTCDLIFTKVKQKGAKWIKFQEFENAVSQIAKKKEMSREEIVKALCSTEGPSYTGTKAQPVRLYEDKSTYTGVHAHGGPSTIDKPLTKFNSGFSKYDPNEPQQIKHITLDQLCDRTPATLRGAHQSFTTQRN